MNALAQRRGACPALSAPMRTGDGLLVRLNPVAGGLRPEALIGLCRAAGRHGNGIVEVTARGSIQIRGLTPDSAVKLADEVNALGIAVRTGVPVETGPLAGLDPDETADPCPLAQTIRAAVEAAGLASRLGPKVSVIVDGGGHFVMDDVLADVRLRADRHADGVVWRIAIGGSAETARPLGIVSEANACKAAVSILEAIAEHGHEGRARDLEPAALSQIIGGQENLQTLPPGKDSAIGIFPLVGRSHALAIALPFGSMPAARIAQYAKAAAEMGCRELRPALGRILIALGLPADACAQLRNAAAELGFVTEPLDPRLHIAACPGAPACASGQIETRAIAESLATDPHRLLDGSFTLHVSGCAKGCAHPSPAALTLVGGENGAGLVVNGTAKDLPSGYASDYEAALGRIAELVRAERCHNETGEACLARLGAGRIAAAFAQG